MICAMLACEQQGGIGFHGRMPWPKNPIDKQWFMNHTQGHIMVMGDVTWAHSSLKHPIAGRESYVITYEPERFPKASGVLSGDLHTEILQLSQNNPKCIVWIIGGADIISQTMNIIDWFFLSKIQGSWPCDKFLPINQLHTWSVVWSAKCPDVHFQILQNPKNNKNECDILTFPSVAESIANIL